jgi:hypothetical protein
MREQPSAPRVSATTRSAVIPGPAVPTAADLPRRLSLLGLLLGLTYLLLVLTSSLPPRLLDPQWQMQFAASCVDSAPIPLVGLALTHLATYLNPDDELLQDRTERASRVAMAAALGLVLLLPLQATAAWRQWQRTRTADMAQRQALIANLDTLRNAVAQAGSSAELVGRLQSLQAPPLSPRDLALPLPELKRRLQLAFEYDEQRLQLATGISKDANAGQLLNRSLRLMLSALMFSFGFAALGQPAEGDSILLRGWLQTLRNTRAANQTGGGSIVDAEYFDQICAADERLATPPQA